LTLINGSPGHLKQAVRYLENAHALSQLIVGNKTPVVAQILVPLGSVLSTMGYYEEGMSYLQEGLDILEQSSMGSVTSHESPRAELDEVFSAIISNLAGQGSSVSFSARRSLVSNIYVMQGLYEECHKKFQDYVRRYHLKFTRDLGLARLHNNWALVLEKIDRPGEAKMLHLEALAIREEISGASSLIVASSCANLGRLCGKLGEFEDGIAYLDRASTIISNSSGQLKDHPIALDLLAAKVTFLDAAGSPASKICAVFQL
jgi:tetratricopeptide (TPR) repeat protein